MNIDALNRHPLLTDFYELTMMNGMIETGQNKKFLHFDVFFREIPDSGGFAIFAGLEQLIDYIENLHFDDETIEFLRAKNLFSESFFECLKTFRFTGDIYAVPEGTPVFPNEPIIKVRAPAIEAQIIETALLLIINHQSLVATKANRIVYAAQGRPVAEFGARRAHGSSAALYGTRAAYIGGCDSTSCTLADMRFGIPASGTMAHSWVQMFDDELDAFRAYCELYPHSTTLLVDTYDVIRSGVPNAIRAFREILIPRGIEDFAIRIDSGDLTYLSKRARALLVEAGLHNCKIVVSNSLDEHTISDLILQGAEVDAFGVGERLITSKSSPVSAASTNSRLSRTKTEKLSPKLKSVRIRRKLRIPVRKKCSDSSRTERPPRI